MLRTDAAKPATASEFDRQYGGDLMTVHVYRDTRLAQIIGGLWLSEALERAARYAVEYRATVTAPDGTLR